MAQGSDGVGITPHGTKRPVSARDVAATVITRVLKDAAFASAVLDAELAALPQLEARDRALATELVYGSLRTRVVLEEQLSAFAKKLDQADHVLHAQLLLAAYQLLLLDRVPAHAVVDFAVGAVKRVRGPRVAGFVNAVLRRLAKAPKLDPADAALRSLPGWLRTELIAAVGEAETLALVAPVLLPGKGAPAAAPVADPPAPPNSAAPTVLSGLEPQPPELLGPLSVRLRVADAESGAALPGWLAAAPRGSVSWLARRPGPVGDPRRLEGYAEGRFVIQEEGAQVIALALGVEPGERVLDACAGRGQKTSLLADLMFGVGSAAQGELWACDLHPNKLRGLLQEFSRLHLPEPRTLAVDFSSGVGGVPGGFDKILVDAPCTGVGTLRRRPEIGMRLQAEDPQRMATLQASILRSAASRLRPAGVLVYAVCSLLTAECEGVLASVSDVLAPTPFPGARLPWLAPGCSAFRLLPSQHQTDGYFVACLTGAQPTEPR